MVNAATPVPEEKKEATPSQETAAPAEKPKEDLTPSSPQDEKVAELEAEVERLKGEFERQQAHTSAADRKARVEKVAREKLEKTLAKIRSGEVSITDEVPEGESTVERETRLEAKVKIQELFLDNPEYQEVLKNDMTLKDVIKNNPFALIGEYLDAQDAADQIKERLDERVSSLRAEKAVTQPKEEIEKGEGKAFEAGAVQPKAGAPESESKGEVPVPTESTIDKIEESIKSKIKFA